jgi:hypothetical protein
MKSTNRHAPTLEILDRTLTAAGRLGIRLARILRTDDHRKLVSITLNPKGYSDWRQFYSDYLAVNLVKKYPNLSLPGVNPRQVAMKVFQESETRCRAKNFLFAHPTLIPQEARVLLARARREVKRVLGPLVLDDIVPYLSHGPGATYGTRKERGHPWFKFGDLQPTVTGECLALHSIFLKYCDSWRNFHEENSVDPKVVGGSKVTTVPKDAKVDRVIAIEPLLNMFYQKGLGGLMRSRLKRSGCNLNDQTINQELARGGSLDGKVATIDLSSASDSISRSLVEYLLPEDWLVMLNATRSNFTEAFGERIFLQKYSSMGNGYTFELESLIFLALGRAVRSSTENVLSVYGDDIVVDSGDASKLIWLLDVCGFKTNISKSYVDGPFRESCGKHYFQGHDVTPLYVKADIQTPDRYLWYLNSIRRLAYRFVGMSYGCAEIFKPVYDFLYRRLEPKFRSLSIPEGYGDGGVLRDFDECDPKPIPVKGWVEGYTSRHLVRVYAGLSPHGGAQLLVSLFRAKENLPRDWELYLAGMRKDPILRARDAIPLQVPMKKYRWVTTKLSVPRWSCLGPWVSWP